MINAEDIAIGVGRLENGKLTESDVDSLVSVFRILCGPLEEDNNYEFATDLAAVDDSLTTNQKAAKLAGTLSRIIDEDFGVDQLVGTLLSDDNDQRRILALFAFSLLYKIPRELASLEAYNIYLRFRRVTSNTVRTYVTL